MLHISASITNPWSNRFDIVVSKNFGVSEYKSIELALYKDNSIIGFNFSIRLRTQDHAGVECSVGVFGYRVEFMFYDNRHYDERSY